MRALIFDLDGVLLDSEKVWRRAYLETFRSRLGVELPASVFPALQGLRVAEVVKTLGEAFSLGADEDGLVEEVTDWVIANLDEAPPIQPSIDFVSQHAHRHARLALASSSPEAVICAALSRLSIPPATFAYVASASSLKYGKPHPEVYLRVAEAMGWAVDACLVFEDSPAGVIAAIASGMHCVGLVREGTDVHEHPAFALCDAVVSSLADLEMGWIAAV